MQFRDVLAAIGRFKILVVAVFVLFVAGGVFAAYSRPASYQARAILVAAPPNGNYAAIPSVQFMLPAVIQQVATQQFETRVLSTLPAAVRSAGVSITAGQAQGTGIINVTATSRDSQVVAPVANAAASELIKSKLTNSVKLTLLQPAAGAAAVGSRLPIVIASVILGLIAAVFASLGAASLRKGAVESGELASRFDLETMGEIPRRRLKLPTIADSFDDFHLVEFTEGFHKLVANLRASEKVGKGSRIAVVSCVGGEGKSTVAAGLAYALALNRSDDVVAIDMDLRRPTLHVRLGVSMSTSRGSEDLTARPTALPNLRVVPAVNSDDHPTRVVTRVFPSLLKEHANAIVVVDTPPLLPVPEATILAHEVGTVIVVVEPGKTREAALEKTLHDLRRANVNVLGAVLNRVKRVERSKLYFGYYGPKPQPGSSVVPLNTTAAGTRRISIQEQFAPSRPQARDGAE